MTYILYEFVVECVPVTIPARWIVLCQVLCQKRFLPVGERIASNARRCQRHEILETGSTYVAAGILKGEQTHEKGRKEANVASPCESWPMANFKRG